MSKVSESYRIDKGFDHFDIGLSACVQKMVRSDLASSGVMFSIDTETGFPDLIVIDGAIDSQFIREQEPFRRALFSGIVGWCDSQGNGEWAVVIRCGVLDGHQVELFAGAGIVAGSDPAMEWAETGTKLETMLKALGLDLEVAQ